MKFCGLTVAAEISKFALRVIGVAGVTTMAISAPSASASTVVVDLTGNNTTADASGNGNNGVFVGTAAYAPIGGTTGFSLNGASYVAAPDAPSLSVPANRIVTLSALVNPTGAGLGSERIIDKITVGTSDGYLIDIVNGQFRVIMAGEIIYDPNAVVAGTTYDVAAVYDGTLPTPTLSFYENGVLEAATTAGSWANGGANSFKIGVDSQGFNTFTGVIANAELSYGAVPEPATWAMMLVGFGGLGATMRSRRKQALAT